MPVNRHFLTWLVDGFISLLYKKRELLISIDIKDGQNYHSDRQSRGHSCPKIRRSSASKVYHANLPVAQSPEVARCACPLLCQLGSGIFRRPFEHFSPSSCIKLYWSEAKETSDEDAISLGSSLLNHQIVAIYSLVEHSASTTPTPHDSRLPKIRFGSPTIS